MTWIIDETILADKSRTRFVMKIMELSWNQIPAEISSISFPRILLPAWSYNPLFFGAEGPCFRQACRWWRKTCSFKNYFHLVGFLRRLLLCHWRYSDKPTDPNGIFLNINLSLIKFSGSYYWFVLMKTLQQLAEQ